MSNPMMFGYMTYLSTHMWGDENCEPRGWYLTNQYTEENNVSLAVWDEMVQFLAEHKYNTLLIDVGDGMRYDSHPEVSAPDAWDKDFLKKKLDEIRALGIEPIPKLNFSTCHHTWLKEYRRMVSTPIYYQVCADLIGEVAEVFGNPRLFHLGLDEEDTIGNQRLRECVHIRGDKLWWHDVYFYFNEVEKRGMRPWVWADPCFEKPDDFISRMPKSVLMSNWFYNYFRVWSSDHWHSKAIRTYELLDKAGFEQVPTASCYEIGATNVYQTLAHGKAVLTPALLKGYMVAPWKMIVPDNIYHLKHDAYALYCARRDLYPETL